MIRLTSNRGVYGRITFASASKPGGARTIVDAEYGSMSTASIIAGDMVRAAILAHTRSCDRSVNDSIDEQSGSLRQDHICERFETGRRADHRRRRIWFDVDR